MRVVLLFKKKKKSLPLQKLKWSVSRHLKRNTINIVEAWVNAS